MDQDKYLFWVEENTLAIRTGPNKNPWNLLKLHNQGFRAILSANDGQNCNASLIQYHGMEYACTSLPASTKMIQQNIDSHLKTLARSYRFIKKHQKHGQVLIHSSEGLNRSGMVLAYYFYRRYNLNSEQSISRVKQKSPHALDQKKWSALTKNLLDQLCQNQSNTAIA